ncbi:YibE/F family protein [Patescibacteria group bacterium]
MVIKNTKRILLLFSVILILFPITSNAQMTENVFEARVIEVIKEQEFENIDGIEVTQQNLRLKGLEDKWKDKEAVFYGISEFEVINSNIYKKGDRVLVNYAQDADGNDVFFVLDYVRRGNLFWLALIFALIIILIGRWKGLKALISLIASFLIIIKFIIPLILDGKNPLLIGIIGSFFILLFIIYLTEGFNKKSHLAVISISISLLITGGLAVLFTYLARLTGTAEEEIMYLMGVGRGFVDFRGLLLTGILIGTLGVLDDMVISQIEVVRQIKDASFKITKKELIKKSFEVGRSHLGAIINTLFLTYAAVSLPFLLLFSAKSTIALNQVINNELIATEIIRTLVGSIGIALALPIATYIAAHHYAKTKKM